MPGPPQPSIARAGFWAALATGGLMAVAFGFAMIAVPPAGPYCAADCRSYPYLDTLDLFPHDYYWMPLAMAATLAWLMLLIVLDLASPPGRRLGTRAALAAGLLCAAVLLPTYAVQLFAVPAGLAAGEGDALAGFTMYNGHGMFIALEELGYGLMSLAFLALALALPAGGRLVAALRGLFALGFVLPALGLAAYAGAYGLSREYRFEVLAISVDWTVLILTSALLVLHFRQA